VLTTISAVVLWTEDGERLLAFCAFFGSISIHQTWDSVYPTGTTTHVSNGKKAMESAGEKKWRPLLWLGPKWHLNIFWEIFLIDILCASTMNVSGKKMACGMYEFTSKVCRFFT
jgi:hypothetical protein